jgi:hypothetical protein
MPRLYKNHHTKLRHAQYNKRNVKKDLEGTPENNNFTENNSNEEDKQEERTEAGMDNRGTMGESALRGLVEEQPQGDGILEAIAAGYERGGNGTATQARQSAWDKE